MADHSVESHFGPDSPLGKLNKMNARVLMIGVGYWSCSSFHLAEYLYTPQPPHRAYACVVQTADSQRWEEYEDVVLDDSQFEDIGDLLERNMPVGRGTLGRAQCRLLPMQEAVNFAAEWMATNRSVSRAFRAGAGRASA